MIECCANCKHCLSFPRNNRYGDIDYLCLINSYYLHGIHKDRNKIKHFSPGGKELECKYERIDNGAKVYIDGQEVNADIVD